MGMGKAINHALLSDPGAQLLIHGMWDDLVQPERATAADIKEIVAISKMPAEHQPLAKEIMRQQERKRAERRRH